MSQVNKKLVIPIIILFATILVFFINFNSKNDDVNKIIDEAFFRELLTVDDIENFLAQKVELDFEITNLYEIAASSLPQGVADLESWYSIRFFSAQGINDISINVMDVVSLNLISERLDKLRSGFGISVIENNIGNQTFGEDLNVDNIGSIILFSQDDKIVILQTSFLNNEKPLTDFNGIVALAQIISQRLATPSNL